MAPELCKEWRCEPERGSQARSARALQRRERDQRQRQRQRRGLAIRRWRASRGRVRPREIRELCGCERVAVIEARTSRGESPRFTHEIWKELSRASILAAIVVKSSARWRRREASRFPGLEEPVPSSTRSAARAALLSTDADGRAPSLQRRAAQLARPPRRRRQPPARRRSVPLRVRPSVSLRLTVWLGRSRRVRAPRSRLATRPLSLLARLPPSRGSSRRRSRRRRPRARRPPRPTQSARRCPLLQQLAAALDSVGRHLLLPDAFADQPRATSRARALGPPNARRDHLWRRAARRAQRGGASAPRPARVPPRPAPRRPPARDLPDLVSRSRIEWASTRERERHDERRRRRPSSSRASR